MIDLEKLRRITCPSCGHHQNLVPDGFSDEDLLKIARTASVNEGNITVCQHCALPLQFNGETWVRLPGEILARLPATALQSMAMHMQETMQRENQLQHAEAVLLILMLIKTKRGQPSNSAGVIIRANESESQVEVIAPTPETKTDHSNN